MCQNISSRWAHDQIKNAINYQTSTFIDLGYHKCNPKGMELEYNKFHVFIESWAKKIHDNKVNLGSKIYSIFIEVYI